MRRKLTALIGLGILGVVLGSPLLADTATRDVRGVQELRQQSDRLRLIAPHGPPRLVPPPAPGPVVTI